MSLPNYLDRLREKIAVWMKRHYRLRQRQLKVVRLEDRRLPDASFALVGDVLTLESFDGASEAVDVSFDANTNEFQLELSSGTWLSENPGPLDPGVSLNGNVLKVTLPSLSELQIHGSGAPIQVTDSGDAFSIGRLTITGAADVVMDSANDIDSISIEADSLTLNDSADLEILSLSVADSVDLSVAGSLTNSIAAQIGVGGHASFEGSSIVLGQHVSDHVELNSFSVSATASVEIDGDSVLVLSSSSTAAQLSLSSTESIEVTDDATLTVDGNTDLTADEINVSGEFRSGSFTFHSAGHVQIHEASEMTLSGNSSAGSLMLEADGLLTDTGSSLLQVTGHAEMTADGITLGNGDVEIGSLQFESAGTVTLLQESEVRLSGDSYAGNLVAEHAELIGTGIVHNGIEISDGGLLGGWLNISGSLTIGPNGVLSPGNSPGITTSGNLTLAANSTLLIELDDDNAGGHPGAVAGVDYDQTQVTGTVTINSTANLNLQDLGSTQSMTGDVYIIVQNDGVDAVVGTFAGLANGTVVTSVAGGTYSIYYNGGTGNDIVLIRRPVAVTDVYVSNTFVGLLNGASVADYNFLTAGNQAGVYGLNAFTTIPEALTAVTAGGIIHVDQGTYLHSSTLAVNKTVTIDGQGMGLTNILKAGAPTGNFDEAIRITADEVILSDAKLGWQIHNTTDYQGYVVITTADFTSINRILFGSNATGEGYRSAVVFEGSGANGADGLEVSDSIFEGRWGRAAIRDGDAGSGQNFFITRNEFREDHFRWGPIAIGPQDSAGTPNNFAFSGEISFNYFGNGLDTLDFQSLGNQNYTVTITNQGLTTAGIDIVHNTFDWNDSAETNANGVYAQPAGVYITPSLTLNTNLILIQDNIFNNFAYAGAQPGTTDPLWRPTSGVFGGALEFDGADDFGVFNSPLFNVGEQGTLVLWMNLDVLNKRHMLAGGAVEFQVRNSNDVYFYPGSLGSNNTLVRSSNTVSANVWTHVAFTWDQTIQQGRIYLNGTEVSYFSGNDPNVSPFWTTILNTVSKDTFIGYDPGNPGSRNIDGKLDDLGFFNDVLSVGEINSVRTNGVAAGFAADNRLVAHWDFDETTGTVATDNKQGIEMHISTNGIVPFGPVYRSTGGRFGGALEFDGANDLATFKDPDFDVASKGTLNFWVKMDNTGVANQFFEGPGNAGFEFQYRTNSTGQIFGRATTAGGDFVIRSGGDKTVLDSAGANSFWHNVQYTWDFSAGQMRIYLNGNESYLAANNQNITWPAIVDTINGLMHMGYDPGSTGQSFDGMMDDVAWYDDVLTSTELAALRTSGVTSHSDLVAHWGFDSAPTANNTYTGDSGTDISLYLQQLPPEPPVTGCGVVTPLAALVLNNVFYNEVAGTYADSNQALDPSNITGAGANPFFAGDDPHTVFRGTTLAEFYRLRFGSSAAYQSTEFQASIATLIPHVGANQENPVAVGTEDILVAGTDFDDLVVITFTSDNDGSFVFTRNVTSGTPDYVGTFNFIDINSFTFDGYGADDVLIIIQPTATQGGFYDPVGGIAFHGDLQNSDGNALDSDGITGGDTLVLLTSASDQAAVDSVSYSLGNDDPATRHQGTITLADGLLSTTITFTGTEPIRDELIVNARTFSFGSTIGGGTETINVSANGDTVVMAAVVPFRPAVSSRTLNNRIVSSLGPNISFANPRTQLTVNAGSGGDTININSLHTDYRAAVTINGDSGTDAVNLNSSLTLGNAVAGNTGNLTVTSETVTVANSVAINTTAESSGDGDIRFTSTGAVIIGSGSSLTTNSGFVIVTTVDGNIDVDGTIATGSDDILLMANGTGRDIEVTADVSSSSGHLTVMADDSVRLLANVDLQIGNAGTLIIEASNDAITMDATASLISANGGIRLLAVNDITLGDVTASNSHVSITSSSGSILDAESSDSEADVVALGLRLQAALGIGTLGVGSNSIETTITTLAARAGSDGINILESNGLTVDDVTVTTQKVQANNSLTATTDAVQSDLVTTNAGAIVLRSTNGSVTLNDGTGSANGIAVSADGTGNVLLQTISGAADIVVNGNVETGVGHVSFFSSDDIDLNANVSTGGSGTAHLAAGNIGNDALTGIDMQNGTSIVTAGGNVRLTADRESDVLLGLINAGRGHVSILAERSVLDNNVATLNVQSNTLRIVADAALSNVANQAGIIGGSETGNPDPNGNNNAIDIQVTTLAARSATGIYLKEMDGLSVDATPPIVVQSVNADASLTAQADASLSDLVTTNNGPIKLQTTAGSLTLNDGDADTLAVSANGTGDILLQTLGPNGDVFISSAIGSIMGNITINSADDIVVNGAITTGGAGTIYLVATNGAADAIGSQVDGIALNFGITSSSGDVLLSSQKGVQQSALISSTSGDIGIIAAHDVDQSAAGDVTTTSGNVLVQAVDGNWTMDADATITAGGGDVLGTAGTNITLGVISATNATANRIALNAVAGSINDANVAAINVEETVAVATTSLSLRAGTIIGGASGTTSAVNNQALDMDVDTVAANAATGIYLREVAAGEAITVDSASAVTVNINGVVRADFRSSTTSVTENRTIASLEDLTTFRNGPIKLVAENGTITLNGGNDVSGLSANGTGDVLLEARGTSSDLIINSTISSDSGHITLDAERSVDVNAALTINSGDGTIYGLSVADIDVDAQVSSANGDILFEAGDEFRQTALINSNAGDIGIIAANTITQAVNGDVITTSGDVLVQATAGNWTMNGDATITAGGGDVLGTAGNSITLGVISATNVASNCIALNAVAGSITDANAAAINVEETIAGATTSLSLRAGTIIGGAGGTTSSINNQALDLDVDTVAANASTGIYLREVIAGGAIKVDTAGLVTVNINGVVRADFDSSTTSVAETRTIASLEDLTSTRNGPIKLVAENGNITLNGGADSTAISANGTGDVLLDARAAGSDLVVDGTVTSGSGHITLDADRSIDINAVVTVNSGSGTVYVLSGTDTDVDALVSSANGDILFEAGDEFRQTALIRSTGGDIGIIAANSITQAVNGDVTATTGDVLVQATVGNWTMNGGATVTAGGGDVLGTAGNSITLGVISATNATANRIALHAVAGSITDANVAAINVEETVAGATTSLSLRAGTIIGGASGTTSSVNNQALDMDVDTVAANATTGIYLREISAGGAVKVDAVSAVTVIINDVVRADFDSSTTSVAESRTIAALDDLTTSNGPIKLVAENGSITVNRGNTRAGSDTTGVSAESTGDILLEARGRTSDLFINTTVISNTGNITLDADRHINMDSSATVTVSAGNGTIYVLAGADIDVDAQVNSANGDILFEAGDEFRQTALINSNAGDIGLIAANSITQAVNGDVTTTIGDVLVHATAGNWTMLGGATITAGGGDVLGIAGNSITLGVISATNATNNRIALSAVAGSITDANAASINVEETVAGATTSLSLRAGTIIGGAGGTTSSVNNQALDLDVDTVAANAATGIYLREVIAGGAINVDLASAVTVNINDVVRADFDSSTTSVAETRTIASLEDLTSTSNGPIKLVAENGNITLNGGADSTAINANGMGDVLLDARGAGSDVVVNDSIESGSGHVTLNAADDVELSASLSTGAAGTIYIKGAGVSINAAINSLNGDVLISSAQEITQNAGITSNRGDVGLIANLSITQAGAGDISTASGDVLIEAGTDWAMSGGTVISAGGGDLDGKALAGDIALGQISSTRTALTAGSNIRNVNGTTLNVLGTSVSLRAGGLIGNQDSRNGTSLINTNAIDTQVTTLAASAGTGIYIEEANSLTIDSVAAVSVSVNGPKQVNFDSATTAVPQARGTAILEDLTTTNSGPIKIVTVNGSLTINGGDSTAVGVSANGTGDVLLEARGAGSDVTLNADISSNAGDMTVIAADSAAIHRDLTTSGTGTVYVQAQSGSIALTDGDSNSTGIQTASGDILLQAASNITLNAELESTAANIGVDAGADLQQNSDISAGADLLLIAGQNITMAGSAVSEADGGELLLNAGANISLGLVQATNVAMESGASIRDVRLDETTNIRATNLRMSAGDEIGAADSVSSADINLNAIDTEVTNLSAQSAAGIHIQEVAAGGSVIVRDIANATASVSVARANFNSTQDIVARTNTLSGLADLTTTQNGDIKFVAKNGSITINDGTTAVTNAANGRGVQAHGSGDVLLEARGAVRDVVVNSSVLSGRGHISLNSVDQIALNASVQTSGNGTVYIVAGNDIDLAAGVTTASGDILVNGGRDLTQTDLVLSTAGDIGLIAGRNILQSASGDTSTSTGDVLIDAGTNWEMDGDATITVGGGQLLGQTQSGRILLGVIELTNTTANQVALSAGTDFADANAATINIFETSASSVTSVSLRSGGAIGNADPLSPSPGKNVYALDLNVDVVSASAVAGIYLREVDAGGGLSVSRVETVVVSIDGVQRSRFNSTNTNAGQNRTLAALEDLVTSNGPVKVVAEDGTIVLDGGTDSIGLSAGGNGDVLVEARGAGHDVVVNAEVSSDSGNVTLNATDDVVLNASLSTGGSGTVFITGAGVSIDAAATTEIGDVLISSTQGISQTAAISSMSGDVGLIASLAILQSGSGDISTVSGDVLIEAGTDWTMANGTVITAGGGDFDGKALTGDITLGRINSERTALTAGSDVSDANSTNLNVVGTSLSLRAGGVIGNHDNVNGTPLSNTNAIDTQITGLAALAGAGIYIEEANSLTIDAIGAVNVSVNGPLRSNFKSTTTDVSQFHSTAALEDLTTTNNGPIKIVTLNGTLTVNGGTSAGLAVSANGTGDVLLEARGTGSDVIVNSDVVSGTGHVSLVAADSVDIFRDIITDGSGRVLVEAEWGSITLADADANITGIRTTSGDILLRAAQNVVLTADLESTSATIGIDAGIDVQQNRNITAGGDVVLVSGQNILMAATAETKADGGEMILAAGQDISLGLLQATNVSLNAGADLRDARVSEATNIRATNLRMIAGDAIGDADSISDSGTNLNAIDTEVTNLAARSGTGIHVREVSSGGSVVVKDIASISVDVTSGRVNFNSTLTDVLLTQRLSGLSDLTTTRNGDIKLLAENGTITILDGSNGVSQSSNDVGVNSHGTGDVLLEARGSGSDMVVGSDVRSGSGHITVNAADDVNLTAGVATSGSGTVYLRSLNNATDGSTGIVMANGTSVTTGGGNIRLVAGNESDIRLGLINAGTGDVSLNAEGSVLDNNGSSLNVQADALRIVADAAISGASSVVSLNGNGVGIIGGPDARNGTPSTNVNALDLQVATLAAQSADGIYLHEMDGVAIQSTDTIAVQQANFNSSTTTQTESSMSDLVTTDNGSIKLLSTEGTVTISDGDGGSVGVVADGSGDVLFQTLEATGDIIVDASVMSTTGHVTLNAADDVDLNASVSTGGAGTVYVSAAGINIDATVTTVNGDIVLSSTQNMSQTALVTSSSGNIGLIATGTISQFNDGDVTTTSGDVLVEAGRNWTMSTGTVIRAGGSDFDGKALTGDIALGQVRSTRAAITAGNDISDANETALNVIGTSVTLRAGGLIGNSDPTNGARLTNLNAIDTQVETLAALAGTGISIEDADSLTIDSVAPVNVAVAGVTQVNFNSTTTSVPQSRGTAILEDLTMTGVGEIRITTVSESITLNRGTAVVGNPLQNIAVYAPGGGKVSIQAAADIYVSGNIVTRAEGVVSTDPATDAIRLIAKSGDIVIGDPGDLAREIVISTDHDEVNGSSDTTNDVVELIARTGQAGNVTVGGKISIQAPVTIRTDGGVAKKFGPRPDVGAASTAFFQYVSNPLPLAIDNSPAAWNTGNAYINAFSMLIGQLGEENLTVDIDWQDPAEEPGVFNHGGTQTIAGNMGIYNQISSERIQQFLVEKGGPSTRAIDNDTNGQIVVGHLYTALDYTKFQQDQNRTTIVIDLSVSHHSSINLNAASIAQSGVTQSVPGLDAASTDIATTVSDRGSDTPDIFENGIAIFKIPTVTPAPPALFSSTFVPRVDRPFTVAPPENQAALSGQNTAEFGSGAVGGSVFSTEVYFQIRRQYETDGPAEVVVERITDSRLISSRDAFEEFVQQNPELQDGAGYEIWLISETGGQKVERPIVEFEISGGQPGTTNESVPDGSPAQHLKDLPFEQPADEQPGESETSPEAQDSEIPQARTDVEAAEAALAQRLPRANSDNVVLAVSVGTETEEEESIPASDALSPSSGALLGLMVRRFRNRQQQSATAQSTFSRAARFQRKQSSPSPEFEVRGSSDV